MGWKNCRGVLLSWDGKTLGESFSAGETNPEESFCPRMEQLQGSHSVLGWNDSREVIVSWDRRTPGESLSPLIERLHRNHSVLG